MKTVKKRTTPAVISDPSIFKAYDIRGTVPDQLNADIAYSIGRAIATYLNPQQIVIGRDARESSEELSERLATGLSRAGVDVIDVGPVSTDALYFAVGKYNYDGGVMVTASHNPAEYNGFKICTAGAVPLSGKRGLKQLRDIIMTGDYRSADRTGTIVPRDIIDDYTLHVLSFIDRENVGKGTIIVDAGNGMGGKMLPYVFNHLPYRLIPMYFELDGRFPNHPASPIEPENTEELRQRVVEEKADYGAAFDGDADRMFLIDEKGRQLGGDVVAALVAQNILRKDPKSKILYNVICSRMVPEVIEAGGGKAIRTPVGHALIKPLMKKHNAIFGAEHSGHYYFRNNWFADSGLIALLVALEAITVSGKPLSELVASIDPYYRSGEINTKVKSTKTMMEKIKTHFSEMEPDLLDGITINFGEWWFNVRPSNTEPLLRLNVEAESPELLEEKTEELIKIIRKKR